ncbi:MAG: hypothetical protein PHS06_03125, partial [Candidatus Shapirobacteria bacterium]|nr:hypothetical protein [Candidatus Shapirobacteria bacterium]
MPSLLPSSNISSIENHVRSYRSALQSNLEITINSLSNSHLKMHSLLHPLGHTKEVDFSALIYSIDRLPRINHQVEKIIIGQSPDVFKESGYKNITQWKEVKSKNRRRIAYLNSQKKILAFFIASVSDIDDLVNILIAFQTEWNKLNHLLRQNYSLYSLFQKELGSEKFFQKLKIDPEKWQSFTSALGSNWRKKLKYMYKYPFNLKVQLLAASWLNYTKSTQKWWRNISVNVSPVFHHMSQQEIYFVSSNTHSLMNIFTGFPLAHQFEIISDLKTNHPYLFQIWEQIKSKNSLLTPTDFIYFVSKHFLSHPEVKKDYQTFQKKLGIFNLPNTKYLDITSQIFPVKNLVKSKYLDPRIKIKKHLALEKSNALILNIDYPLGFAAYHILSEIMENVKNIKGVYILGKAAALNSEVGDLLIPRLIFDEHTQNSYLFKNCFNDFFPFVNNQGSILTNQKAVSVFGTFLENKALLNFYFKNNITVIEMESGPYLSAVTESCYDQQAPKKSIVDLNNCPFDLGIINYASDTPYSSLQNLGD